MESSVKEPIQPSLDGLPPLPLLSIRSSWFQIFLAFGNFHFQSPQIFPDFEPSHDLCDYPLFGLTALTVDLSNTLRLSQVLNEAELTHRSGKFAFPTEPEAWEDRASWATKDPVPFFSLRTDTRAVGLAINDIADCNYDTAGGVRSPHGGGVVEGTALCERLARTGKCHHLHRQQGRITRCRAPLLRTPLGD